MGKIKIMSSSLASKIAAGEVITRPVNAVKELVENALDSGADEVRVEIFNGGKKLIEVSDNGCGMDKEDLELCLCSHATSKIFQLDDFTTLNSFGFRGEALFSIASVSKITVESRVASQPNSWKAFTEGGSSFSMAMGTLQKGTRVEVRNLFYNIPARLKFLKSDAYEKSLIQELLHSFVASRPDVAFSLVSDSEEVFRVSPKHGEAQILAEIFSVGDSGNLIEVKNLRHPILGVQISGWLAKPKFSRANSRDLKIFVNHRIVKHGGFLKAITGAYDTLLAKKWPVGVIRLKIPSRMVDVNVHPMKMEVRIENEQILEEFLFKSLRKIILETSLSHVVPVVKKSSVVILDPDFTDPSTSLSGKEVKSSFQDSQISLKEKISQIQLPILHSERFYQPVHTTAPASELAGPTPDGSGLQATGEPLAKWYKITDSSLHECSKNIPQEQKKDLRSEAPAQNEVLESKVQPSRNSKPSLDCPLDSVDFSLSLPVSLQPAQKKICMEDFVLIGQVAKTFIAGEWKHSFVLIDQHIAQERVLYEKYLSRLKKNSRINKNPLLIPARVMLPFSLLREISEDLEILENLGFGIRVFEKEVEIFQVPDLYKGGLESSFFEELVVSLRKNPMQTSLDSRFHEISANLACKGSIKAGDVLNEMEMKSLLAQLFACENPFACPHSRPVIVEYPFKEIFEKFSRVYKPERA